MSDYNPNVIQPDTGRKLYTLTVKDAATARLLEIVSDPDFTWDPADDDDDASGVIQAGFWLLLATPFISLFLLGLLFGSGN